MSSITRLWYDNPVFVKELRARMRGTRAYWLLAGYLAVLSGVLFFSYVGWWNTARTGGGLSEIGSVGTWFYQIMIAVEAFLVVFIAPSITAASLTVEREQRTMDLLAVTPIARIQIVVGKLLAAFSFLGLLLSASLPLVSLCFLLGGVDAGTVARDYLNFLLYGLDLAALALAWSSVARNTSAAISYTYATLLAPYLLGSLVIISFQATGPGTGTTSVPATPKVGVAGMWHGLSFIAEAVGTFVVYLAGTSMSFGASNQAVTFYGLAVPWWLLAIATHGLIVAILAGIAAMRLEVYPERKAGWLRLLVAAFVLTQSFLFFGLRAGRAIPWNLGPPLPGPSFQGSLVLSYPQRALLLFYPLAMLLWLAPMFTTGQISLGHRPNLRRSLAQGWRLQSLKAGTVESALPYLLLVLAGILLLFALSVAPIGAGNARLTTNALVLALQTGAATGAAILGIWCVGLLLSALIPNRWTALIIAYALIAYVALAPILANGKAAVQSAAPGGLFLNLYYLNPLVVLLDAGTNGKFFASLNLIPGSTPGWICCILGWSVIAFIALGLFPLAERRASRQSHKVRRAGGQDSATDM